MGIKIYDWQEVLENANEMLRSGECRPNWRELSRKLDVPRSTLRDGFLREFDITIQDLKKIASEEDNSEKKTGNKRLKIISEEEAETQNHVRKEVNDNNITIESKSIRITNLEQLIEFCEIDLDEWIIERWIANKWEVGIKTFDDKIKISPLWQIKAWLKPKKLLPTEFTIQPINIQISPLKPSKAVNGRGISSDLVIADIHSGFSKDINTGELIPFHDRNSLDIALQIWQTFDFQRLVIVGDSLDLPDWSDKFIRSPEYYWGTQSAIIELSWWLGQFRIAKPEAEIHMLSGNHENRLENSIITSLQAAYNLKPADEIDLPPALSVERLLSLHSLNINYVKDYPHGKIWITDKLKAQHGNIARKGAGNTVGATITESEVSTIQGHAHRLEMVSRTLYYRGSNDTILSICSGCLCRTDGTVPGSSETEQWQKGCTHIEYDGLGNITPTLIPFKNNMAILRGHIFKAENRLNDIKKDTNWKF